MMMIPEAWENHTMMDDNRRAFYEYHAAMMEPWMLQPRWRFTDGRQIGGTLIVTVCVQHAISLPMMIWS